jgi:hypothetical protein
MIAGREIVVNTDDVHALRLELLFMVDHHLPRDTLTDLPYVVLLQVGIASLPYLLIVGLDPSVCL